jgi:hypothetical protein
MIDKFIFSNIIQKLNLEFQLPAATKRNRYEQKCYCILEETPTQTLAPASGETKGFKLYLGGFTTSII